MCREQEPGPWIHAGPEIGIELNQGYVKDVPGGRLDRTIQPVRVLRYPVGRDVVLLLPVRLLLILPGDHPTPPSNGPGLPHIGFGKVGLVLVGTVAPLPLVELGEGIPERLPIPLSYLLRDILASVFVDVLSVLRRPETVEVTEHGPFSRGPSVLSDLGTALYLLSDDLLGDSHIDVFVVRERRHQGWVFRPVSGYPELLLSEVTLDDRESFFCSNAPTVFIGLLLIEALNIGVSVEDPAGNSAGRLNLREYVPILIEVLRDAPVLAVFRSCFFVVIQSFDERVFVCVVERGRRERRIEQFGGQAVGGAVRAGTGGAIGGLGEC